VLAFEQLAVRIEAPLRASIPGEVGDHPLSGIRPELLSCGGVAKQLDEPAP
jgi:hypothetical protein